MFRIHRMLFAAIAAVGLHGQITQLDLHYQGKDVDFSTANATKPFKSGTTFPSVCAVGEMFFKTDGPQGANLYGCASLNSWSLEQSSWPAVTGNSGKVMTTDGNSLLFGSLGGDISGPVSGATVTQIQGRPVSSAAPGSGQALAWNATTLRWEPQTVASSGGSGASMISQIGDFAVTRTSATVLAIGASCSLTTPCTARFGSLVYSFPTGATVSISAGTGTAYVYISSAGALTVGHNVTLTCSGCTAQAGITAFPSDSIPLWSWTATSASWDTSGGTDRRGFLSGQPLASGTGIVVACTNGICSPSLDAAYLSTFGNSNWIQRSPTGSQTIQPASAGAITRFFSTATDPGIVHVPGALPSSPVAGAQQMTTAGRNEHYDGAAWQQQVTIPDGTATVIGHIPSWATTTGGLGTAAFPRSFGAHYGDTTGSALTSGSVRYFTVPYACTISAWNIAVDAGTATVDIWKIASGTSIPTVANSITAAALPAISSGTAIHSTTLTGWNTTVSANDIFGFQLKTVATAKYVDIDVECDQ